MSFFLQSNLDINGTHRKTSSVREFNLEEEHRKMMQKLDIDNYSLSRIPRPEEEEEERKKINTFAFGNNNQKKSKDT